MMRSLCMLVVFAGLFTACVPKSRLTYLQQSDNPPATYQLQRSTYQVQPNDILNITVRSLDPGATEMFNAASSNANNLVAGDIMFYLMGYSIDLQGYIEMPIIGKVYVAGKNTEEIKLLVQEKLSVYFQKDAAFVNVQLAGIRFAVIGDVSRPGKYIIYQNQVNIFEALAQAGDITIVGDRKEVQIVRQTPEGVKVMELDLTNAEVINTPEYFIQPNDLVNVKPLNQKTFGIGTTGFGTFASILGVVASAATLIFTLSRIE